jgi:hypothetical protein
MRIEVQERQERPHMLTIKSSQKLFTEDEVTDLTGICLNHLRDFAKSRKVGFISRVAEAAGASAEKLLFTNSDLLVVAMLLQPCEH